MLINIRRSYSGRQIDGQKDRLKTIFPKIFDVGFIKIILIKNPPNAVYRTLPDVVVFDRYLCHVLHLNLNNDMCSVVCPRFPIPPITSIPSSARTAM